MGALLGPIGNPLQVDLSLLPSFSTALGMGRLSETLSCRPHAENHDSTHDMTWLRHAPLETAERKHVCQDQGLYLYVTCANLCLQISAQYLLLNRVR